MKLKDLIPARWSGPHSLAHRDDDSPFVSLQREMNRVFDDFFKGFAVSPALSGGLMGSEVPKVDVSETEKEVHVSADLPGIDEKDVDVSLANGVLTIKGEKKVEKEEKDKNYHRVERSYGSFQRAIPLPCEVDEDKAEASFKQGVLTIKLPKTKEAQHCKKIAVKSGG